MPAEMKIAIDSRDVGTPDEWISRHPDLIRLTGRHPFNCEAPLSSLREAGFFTPTPLHYVRNHGAVPRLDWDTHRIEVGGLVSNSLALSMEDITTKFPIQTIPVTLVCAGNRRKEQNMVKQSIGFNWGSAAVSTSTWTGVRLCDVLHFCGILDKSDGARYVCFDGPKGELPKGDTGTYGTSITYEHAMAPANDVMIAWEQNGQKLAPDHGYPVRILIPGYIGGRMVKWLSSITVTSVESDNYYHYNDNRVLPSHVDAEKANSEGWWTIPDYIINNLNINSAIWSPAHDEIVPLNGPSQEYTIKGYAYNGGGRKVTRVEVSVDGGHTWILTAVRHPETPTALGKFWCWCFWETKLSLLQLMTASDVRCRAWDDSCNTQPSRLTWNVMGMMNNCEFQVKVHACQTAAGGLGLRFEHPTQAGPQPGGWMVKTTPAPGAATTGGTPAPVTAAPPKVFGGGGGAAPAAAAGTVMLTMEQVEKHASESDCWIVIKDKVYDVTQFLATHPGGAQSIVINAGTDSTEEFFAIHSEKAVKMLDDWYIGDLNGPMRGPPPAASPAPPAAPPAPAAPQMNGVSCVRGADGDTPKLNGGPVAVAVAAHPVTLNPKQRIPLQLVEKEALSHDVRRLRFALPSPQHVLGLPIGLHIFLSAKIDGKMVMRAYTPVSSDDDVGFVEFVIKVYFAKVNARFPTGGVFTQLLDSLAIGDSIDFKGPIGHIVYKGRGQLVVDGKSRQANELSMISGGTGITPMMQLVRAIMKDEADSTKVALLYANKSVDDILLRSELDSYAARYPSRFRVWYTVDEAPKDEPWPYSQGFVTQEMLAERLYGSGPDSIALMCGPPPMLKFACIPNLEKLGFDDQHYLSF